MNNSVNRPDRRRITAALAFTILAAFSAALLSLGCPKQNNGSNPVEKPGAKKGDPWEAAAKRLHKDTDIATCKSAIGQLNNDLADRTDIAQPKALTPEAEKALRDLVPLANSDLEEIRSPVYSGLGLDPVYIADCFYLRDAARSLDFPGVTPAEQADLGFAWVCRQVYLHPWIAPVPPTYVLRRGYGSGLERAYVFMALLQQMGLDSCLIGPLDAVDKAANFIPAMNGKQSLRALPQAPFWAVGVRIGAEIQLYDPWRGLPFPGIGGKVGTLAQIKAKPDLLKTWRIAPEQIKAATVYLAVPISSLSPRMALLEEKLRSETGLKLAIDPAALRNRFLNEALKPPAFTDTQVRFWNPPGDRSAYGRILATFLPQNEGGLDRSNPNPSEQLYAAYKATLFPPSILKMPEEITELLAQEWLRSLSFQIYMSAFYNPPSPREKIQRGQFQEASRWLADRQDEFRKGSERARADPGAMIEWCNLANQLFKELSIARNRVPPNQAEITEVENMVDQFKQNPAQMVGARVIIDRASAGIGLTEAFYLLALCKQEEAERLQARTSHAGAETAVSRAALRTAWEEAFFAWESFKERGSNQAAYPGRSEHAQTLAARADEMRKK